MIPIHDRPDGWNINEDSGATHPEVVARAVVAEGAHAGVAQDGDADRAMFADERGNVVDGDQVLGASAIDLHARGELPGDLVVTTVMANQGFRRAMARAGIGVRETKVGDRYVLEEMLATRAELGGEQSGHVIFLRPRDDRGRAADRGPVPRAGRALGRGRWPRWPDRSIGFPRSWRT